MLVAIIWVCMMNSRRTDWSLDLPDQMISLDRLSACRIGLFCSSILVAILVLINLVFWGHFGWKILSLMTKDFFVHLLA